MLSSVFSTFLLKFKEICTLYFSGAFALASRSLERGWSGDGL